MKLLFVSSELFNRTGGGEHMRAYLDMFKNAIGEDCVIPFAFPRRGLDEEDSFKGIITKEKYSCLKKIINVIRGGDPLIGRDVESQLLQEIKTQEIDIVFIARSTQGKLLRIIKQKYQNVPIIAFYHDIFPMVYEYKKHTINFKSIIRMPLNKRYLREERYCAENADINIVLNRRDADSFEAHYHKKPELVIPIIWKDSFDEKRIDNTSAVDKLKILFVGSYFPPNVNGITWFVEKVMPYLGDKVLLQVVGNNMENIKHNSLFQDRRIDVIGSVSDVSDYYYSADVVIAPIFEGTGMKTKVAEAMMYGKIILASSEALCGYDEICERPYDSSEDYIKSIHEFIETPPAKYNPIVRDKYVKFFSTQSAIKKIQDSMNLLEQRGNKKL